MFTFKVPTNSKPVTNQKTNTTWIGEPTAKYSYDFFTAEVITQVSVASNLFSKITFLKEQKPLLNQKMYFTEKH